MKSIVKTAAIAIAFSTLSIPAMAQEFEIDQQCADQCLQANHQCLQGVDIHINLNPIAGLFRDQMRQQCISQYNQCIANCPRRLIPAPLKRRPILGYDLI